jgi:hypothetical protein
MGRALAVAATVVAAISISYAALAVSATVRPSSMLT